MEPARSVRTGTGWLVFAAVIIFIAGFHNLIYGVAALDDYAVLITEVPAGNNAIIYQDLTFWGWLLIAMGAVEIIAAAGIVTGKLWARWLGIAICLVNAIAHLAFLAVFPVWAIVVIALDVLVIYALTRPDTPGRGAFEPYPETDRIATRAGRTEQAEASRSSAQTTRSGPDMSTR